MIRFFDILFSLIGLFLTAPIFIALIFIIPLENFGSPFFSQPRVGKNQKMFSLIKFRTMIVNANQQGLLTTSESENRITKIGFTLRKYKIDEIPQLINVLAGQMSIVGPRPEVKQYVDLYTAEQLKIFKIKPGITDFASIKYRNESIILQQQVDPVDFYIKTIMPDKLRLSFAIVDQLTLKKYFSIIIKTLKVIICPQ